MESCKNCKHLIELDIHARNYECAKYVDKDGAQIMGENTIFAKVAMESKPAMCEEWQKEYVRAQEAEKILQKLEELDK